MKKFAILAPAALLALSACGETTDASEDAVADTVEVPADEAMEGAPDPVMDDEAMTDEEAIDQAESDAEAAADEAMDAVEAAEAANEMVEEAE